MAQNLRLAPKQTSSVNTSSAYICLKSKEITRIGGSEGTEDGPVGLYTHKTGKFEGNLWHSLRAAQISMYLAVR